MKKLLCVCVMMIFVLSSMSVFATDSAEGMIMQDKENEAIIKYNELLDEWTSGVDTEGNVNIAYPDYYGGAYIDDDKNLVILVTTEIEVARKEIRTIINLADIKFENVTNSFNQLREEQDEIESDVETSKGLGKGITGIGLSVKENMVTVYSEDTRLKKNLKSVIEKRNTDLYNCVKVVIREGKDTPAAALVPGSSISSLGGTRSVGFWAKDSSGNLGIITAPHSSMKKGESVRVGGITFGAAELPYFSGKVDAVFVRRTNTSFTATREIPGFRFSLKKETKALPVGSTVYSRGEASDYMTGKVEDVSYTTTYGISDTVLVDVKCKSGDSGGIVAGGGTISERYVTGIITGKQANTDKLIYVKGANIVSRLNITLY